MSGRLVRRGHTSSSGWVENIDPFDGGADAGAADWVEGLELDSERNAGGPRFDTTGGPTLDLAFDPGESDVVIRSPVTGKIIERGAREGVMPTLSATSDPLAALGDFSRDLRDEIRVAVRLPGPVMTGPGQPPKQICRAVAVAMTATEIIMRDEDRGDAGIVRLPFASLSQVDVVQDGQQVSLTLADNRAVHLDLRALRARDWTACSQFLQHLERQMES